MSQIDFFQAIKHNWLVCKDCKDITAESSAAQHRIVILDICIISRKRGIKNTCKRGVWRVEREKGIVIKAKPMVECIGSISCLREKTLLQHLTKE